MYFDSYVPLKITSDLQGWISIDQKKIFFERRRQNLSYFAGSKKGG